MAIRLRCTGCGEMFPKKQIAEMNDEYYCQECLTELRGKLAFKLRLVQESFRFRVGDHVIETSPKGDGSIDIRSATASQQVTERFGRLFAYLLFEGQIQEFIEGSQADRDATWRELGESDFLDRMEAFERQDKRAEWEIGAASYRCLVCNAAAKMTELFESKIAGGAVCLACYRTTETPTKKWHRERISDKQLALLEEKGVPADFARGLNRGEASALITQMIGS